MFYNIIFFWNQNYTFFKTKYDIYSFYSFIYLKQVLENHYKEKTNYIQFLILKNAF